MTTIPRHPRTRTTRRIALLAASTLVIGLGAIAAARSADWPVYGGGVTRSGVAEEAVKTPLSLLWKYTGAPQSPDPCAPVVAGKTAYFAARSLPDANNPNPASGTLYAVDTATGALRWKYALQGNNLFTTPPTVDGTNLYIGASDGGVYIINTDTGQPVHAPFQTPRSVDSAPTVVDGVLYFGSNSGKFYAFNTETGERVWRTDYNAGDAVNSAPIIANGYVFFTTSDNAIHAVKQATGTARWRFRLPNRIPANGPIFADSTLYVPGNQRMYAIQPTSGNVRWARDLPNEIVAAPAAESGLVYALCKDQKGTGALLYALHSNNGKDAWAKPAPLDIVPSSPPTISGDIIFVPTVHNVLYALSKDDGHILWQYHLEATINRPNAYASPTTALSAPIAVSSGSVYVLSDDGTLSAFRPDAPDTTGPTIFNQYPAVAQRVNGNPPFTLAAYLSDLGSGIDPNSVKMTLDGKDVVSEFDADRGLAYYQTKSSGKTIETGALGVGRHTATITASDWRGNVSTETWSFIVDNSVAPATRTGEAPVAPTSRRPGSGGGSNTSGGVLNPNGSVSGPGGTNTGRGGGGRRGGGRARGNGGGNL